MILTLLSWVDLFVLAVHSTFLTPRAYTHPPPRSLQLFTSTMHRALDVSEILHLIFSYITAKKPRWGTIYNGGTLVNLAKTCRRFRVPATEAVWSDLTSLEPIWNLMDEDLWSREEEQENKYVQIRVFHCLARVDCPPLMLLAFSF
jgi:hypothetical protein